MLQNSMIKQIIDFHKTTFDSSFNAFVKFQDQGENMMGMLLNQAVWIPSEGKKAVLDWVDGLKKGREQFKQTVDLNFSKIENSFSGAEEKKK